MGSIQVCIWALDQLTEHWPVLFGSPTNVGHPSTVHRHLRDVRRQCGSKSELRSDSSYPKTVTLYTISFKCLQAKLDEQRSLVAWFLPNCGSLITRVLSYLLCSRYLVRHHVPQNNTTTDTPQFPGNNSFPRHSWRHWNAPRLFEDTYTRQMQHRHCLLYLFYRFRQNHRICRVQMPQLMRPQTWSSAAVGPQEQCYLATYRRCRFLISR